MSSPEHSAGGEAAGEEIAARVPAPRRRTRFHGLSPWTRLRSRFGDTPEDLVALYHYFRACGDSRLRAMYRSIDCIL